jgi:hypothetical protein
MGVFISTGAAIDVFREATNAASASFSALTKVKDCL